MNTILPGNIISLIGASMMVLVGLIKKQKNILLAQSAQFAVMGIGNAILGGLFRRPVQRHRHFEEPDQP